VAVYDRLYDDHADLAGALGRVAQLSTVAAEKVSAYRQSAEMRVRLEGRDGPNAVLQTLNWARSLVAADRPGEAVPLFESLEQRFATAFGEDDARAPAPWLGKAEALVALGNHGAAREALDQARRRMTGAADRPENQQWLARVEATLGG
jgi:hypothetical protein